MSDATTKQDGGPAFPSTPMDRSGQIAPHEMGISIRDYFAGQAMSAIDIDLLVREAGMSARETVIHRARLCYMFADSMLKVREE